MELTQPTVAPQPEKKKNKSVLFIFLVLCIVVLASVGSFILGQLTHSTVVPKGSGAVTKEVVQDITPTAIPSVEVTTQNVQQSLITQYSDTDIPFSLSYPKNWVMKKTYGKSITKTAPTDVLSGIELDNPQHTVTFVVNVINGKNASSIVSWWQTSGHTTFNTTQPNFSFKGIDAIKVSSTPGGNPPSRVQDETYFLWKGNVYFLSMQYTPYAIDPDAVNIYNSFTPAQQ